MKQLLFLDFDGVLHGEHEPLFCRRTLLAQCLQALPRVEIVISSSWRQEHALDDLRVLLGAELGARVIGVTPTLEVGYLAGGRQREIEAWLDAAGLHEGNARWLALDDVAHFFDPDCRWLLLVDGLRGFGAAEGASLRRWECAADTAGAVP